MSLISFKNRYGILLLVGKLYPDYRYNNPNYRFWLSSSKNMIFIYIFAKNQLLIYDGQGNKAR